MSGKLGLCLQCAHERLREKTKLSSNLVKTIHGEDLKLQNYSLMKVHTLFKESKTNVSRESLAK